LLFPVHLMNLNLLMALGRSDFFLRLDIIKRLLVIINVSLTWRWGISAMICGMIVSTIVSLYLNSYYTGRLIDYPLWEQLGDLLSYLIMAILMGLTVYATGMLPFPHLWSMLLVQIAVGIVVYVGLCRLFRLTAFMEIWPLRWGEMPFLRTEI